MLFFTGKNKKEEVREFGCSLELLEEELDFLNKLIVKGYTLVTAYLTDGSSRIDLPIEAFDGLPLSVFIRALQDEWESILYPSSLESTLHKQERIDLLHQQIYRYQITMTSNERMLGYLKGWQQNAQKIILTPHGHQLFCQYKTMILHYQQHLEEGQVQLVILNRRLRELTA